jgi:hypothetical protein
VPTDVRAGDRDLCQRLSTTTWGQVAKEKGTKLQHICGLWIRTGAQRGVCKHLRGPANSRENRKTRHCGPCSQVLGARKMAQAASRLINWVGYISRPGSFPRLQDGRQGCYPSLSLQPPPHTNHTSQPASSAVTQCWAPVPAPLLPSAKRTHEAYHSTIKRRVSVGEEGAHGRPRHSRLHPSERDGPSRSSSGYALVELETKGLSCWGKVGQCQ